MKRRDLLAGLLPVAVVPLAGAQQPGKMYRVAMFHPTHSYSTMSEHGGSTSWRALFEELRRLGYDEGRNLTVERYTGGGQEETYPQLARKVVATQPDLILSMSEGVPFFADAAAGRVPIIGYVDDTGAAGLSTSLSRPSANVTGIVTDPGVIVGKRFQMLREVRPEAKHIAMLAPHRHWEASDWVQRSEQQHGMRLTCLCVASPLQEAEYRKAFANLDHGRPDFIVVWGGSENITHRDLIVGLVNERRILALYPMRAFVEVGGLMSYGYDPDELFRYLARQIDLILRGRPVSEVPFYMPIKWELAVNLGTAKAIGLEIPPSVLFRADLVIE